MAYDTLKGLIRQYIKTNGQNEITGQILQNVLIAMVDEYPALTGYATQTWVQNWVGQQGYVTQSWVEAQGYLNSNTVLINSVVRDADGSLQFMGPNFVPVVVDLTHTHRFEELTDLPTTLEDYGITDALSTSTTLINSVTKSNDGGLKFMGSNFVDTYIDFTHTHRFEELTDLPTTLKDYGITDAATISMLSNYLPLTGGTLIGGVAFQYMVNPSDPEYFNLTIEDGIITLNELGKIQNSTGNYYFDNNGNAVFNSLTIGGYTAATQNWVNTQLINYATQLWVNTQLLGYLPTSTSLINSVTKSNDGGLKFMGSNFVDTYIDFTHTHRFEELTDLPTTLQDYGITDAATISMLSNYLPLTGGTLIGGVAFQYMVNPSDPEYFNLTIEDGIITLNELGKIQNSTGNYYFDNNGNAVFNSLTIGGYTAATQNWVNTQLSNYATQSWVNTQLLGYLPTSTSLINSVTKSNDGGLKFMGSNFVDTYIDFTHTHRFEELTDLPTTLKDYGITDAATISMLSNYLPLTGGTLIGAVAFQYMVNPSDPEYFNITIEDGIITLNELGKIQNSTGNYYFDNNGNAVFNTLTIGGYTAATQNWVSQQGYLTSASLNDYALKSWVNTQLLGYLPTSTVTINSVTKSSDGSIKFVGSNFVDTYVDLTHTHRFEELTDLPTKLQDYGITDAVSVGMLSNYLPLTGGTLIGGVAFQYMVNPSDPEYFNLTIEDGIITLNELGKIQNSTGNYYFDNNGNAVFNSLTIGGYTAATQNWVNTQLSNYATQSWVSQQGYLTSASLNDYALKSWVNTQLLGYLPTSTALVNAIVKSADGSMKFSGSNFADVYTDFTHTHRWEEITDRPNIEIGSYGSIYTDDNFGIGTKTPTNKLEVKGMSFFYYNMGVGTSPTNNYTIDVDGEVRASGFVNNSDARLKNIEDYDACIFTEAVAMAPAIHYHWKNRKYKSTKVGSIAQYWQNLLPEAVSTDDKGYLSMQYDVIALISAISVAKRTIEHEQRIAELESENTHLRLELNTIKEVINNKSIN